MKAKNVGKAASLAVLGLAGSGAADAATIVNLPMSQVLANSQSTSASFNISNLLSPPGGPANVVTAATLSIQGYSPYGSTGTVYAGYSTSYTYYVPYTYSYSCGSWWSSSTCYATGYYPATGYTPAYTDADQAVDTLGLNVGGAQQAGLTSRDTSYAGNYYGSAVATMVLTTSQIGQLNTSGLLNFTVTSATNTSFQLGNASLSLELAPPAVPEPATWAMMIAGFGVVGAAMRRQSRRKRVVIA